jgi:coenzyme F420-0:L-glutamate ligase/coenzyme F420-1:gamma-L-glutamate ligase
LIEIIPIKGIPLVRTEDELWQSLLVSTKELLQDGDILLSAHTPWSRVRGPIYKLDEIKPSEKAIEIAQELEKEPEKIEAVLQSSREIVKTGRKVIISENFAGVVCANAGIDQSNAGLGYVIGVPRDPDGIALEIKNFILNNLKKDIAVIITDTVGRALRRGAVNIAIGVAGISPMKSEIGKKDLFGYEMKVSEIAVADEIASASELVQGQTDEGVPFVIVRGYKYDYSNELSAKLLNRPKEERLFQ